MILGQVNAFRQPVITVSVRDTHGQAHDYLATIDTGFSGFLTLASDVIIALGLP